MKILALDTSGELCSTALMINGSMIIREELVPRRHANVVLDMLDDLLAEGELHAAELDAIAFGRGPGSFTGVRIAAAVTQGIAYSLEKPVVPVSTLAALAQRVVDNSGADKVLTALDARMSEVYWAGYQRMDNGFVETVVAESVLPPASVVAPNSPGWVAAGNGWFAYQSDLASIKDSCISKTYDIQVHASSIARLGEHYFNQGRSLAADQAIPVYLRDNVARKKSV